MIILKIKSLMRTDHSQTLMMSSFVTLVSATRKQGLRSGDVALHPDLGLRQVPPAYHRSLLLQQSALPAMLALTAAKVAAAAVPGKVLHLLHLQAHHARAKSHQTVQAASMNHDIERRDLACLRHPDLGLRADFNAWEEATI